MTAEKADEPRFLISDLLSYLENYLSPVEIREVYRAYLYGADAHVNQKRLSGEPYIYHPIAVARILASMRLDYKCLMAAILHDVVEDTPASLEEIRKNFGEEVALIVDGVSKLDQIAFRSRAEAQAESFRKMLLAMVGDIRVILVKLADRTHNMRTLWVMPVEKRRRIARDHLQDAVRRELAESSTELEGELGCRRQSVELRRLSEEVAERLDDERAGAPLPGRRTG